MKQSFPSTGLFPVPILYWLKYPQKPDITLIDLKDAFFYIPLHPDSQPLFAFKVPTNPSQQWLRQFTVLLKKTWSWAPWALHLAGPFYAPSNTPIWALYNKWSLQIHISAGPMDQIPALSQGILTSAYVWALHPVLSGASGDYTGQPLRQVPPHLPVIASLPNSSWVLVSEGDLLGLGTDEWVTIPSPMESTMGPAP
jgi:hypothetical protein